MVGDTDFTESTKEGQAGPESTTEHLTLHQDSKGNPALEDDHEFSPRILPAIL